MRQLLLQLQPLQPLLRLLLWFRIADAAKVKCLVSLLQGVSAAASRWQVVCLLVQQHDLPPVLLQHLLQQHASRCWCFGCGALPQS